MLSVIIPTYNRPEPLKLALQSLVKQSIGRDNFEVVVINDGGKDVQKEINLFKDRLAVKYINQPHGNVSVARNIGIGEAKGQIAVFFDDDAQADPNWLMEMARVAKTEDIVVGRGQSLTNNLWQYFAPHYDRGNQSKLLNNIWECNLAVQLTVFNRVGKFSEKIGWGHEGNEFADRCKKAGFKIKYCPQAVIYHDYASGLANYFKKQFLFGRKSAQMKKQGIDISQFAEKLYNEKLEKLPWLKKIFVKLIAKIGSLAHYFGSLFS